MELWFGRSISSILAVQAVMHTRPE